MKTYEVTVSRDERWWMVAVPELGGVTQARRLDEVERMAREYIAVSTDVPLSKVAVEVAGIEADGRDLLEAKTLVDGLRRRAKELEALVAELTREVASALTDASVPVRDVSSVLGVSHQRVSQLVQAAAEDAAGAKVMRQARQEFAHDLVIRLDDGRSLQLVEVTAPKNSRRKKPQTAPQAADRPVRATRPARRAGKQPV
ncbi:type II toxin-antitoxin system HicB family antitoxin [Kribbella sp. NBC_00482]|uniref:type II toxin-antitoxin system HicB family antitoxin n=1 Tax=Kribbella sp. NBC_00482 TaxID=2975968 RepID=UPI002E177F3C